MPENDKEPVLSGTGLFAIVVLLVAHWTVFTVLIQLGVFTYQETRWYFMPVPLALGVVFFLYSYGTKKGFVEEIPSEKKRRYDVAVVASVVLSAVLSASAFVFA